MILRTKWIYKITLVYLGLLIISCNSTKQKTNNEQVIETAITDTIMVMKEVFDMPELQIKQSPATDNQLILPTNYNVKDYDVSPVGNSVALLISQKEGLSSIKFWQMNLSTISDSCLLPQNLKAFDIVWHPSANALFVLSQKDENYVITRIQKVGTKWVNTDIFNSKLPLKKLIVCPRPFVTGYNSKTNDVYYAYRLFFGMDNGDGSYRIVSVTENGRRFYQVVGPEKSFSKFPDEDVPPSSMEAGYALPIAFHPAGHQLIWEDKNHTYFFAPYQGSYWENYSPLNISGMPKGYISPLINGLGFLNWEPGTMGFGLYLLSSRKSTKLKTEYTFNSMPANTPDGKGIVGITEANNQFTLHYLTIDVPLADVNNAWMYVATDEELNLFRKNYGLFRRENGQQLYYLYETENYYCGSYDRRSPTRPYLVTTDIFWEIFGAAYQGLFILKEREEAIPNFWNLINEIKNHFSSENSTSKWLKMVNTILDLKEGNTGNPEVKNILSGNSIKSEITGEIYNFSELKPRGHYTSTPEMQVYFKAFRYFTTLLSNDESALNELHNLPVNVSTLAEKWINGYSGFIAPSRGKLAWNIAQQKIPDFCNYPLENNVVFPLSWGFDNEIIYSTIYHSNLPKELQITGPHGDRLLPQGIDLATVMGNLFAEKILEPDYIKYPPLRKVIDNLKVNFTDNAVKSDVKDNIYHKWINALAVQWADSVYSTNGEKDNALWQTKRLQTGLATWATLRHATVLVNERSAAECGEGGFEEILMQAPRGYVEPDPYTFETIATLFEAAINLLPKLSSDKKDITYGYSEENDNSTLNDGIVKRLKDAANEARIFKKMAEKERRGEPLSAEENEKILVTAGIAEHYFLMFNSLSNKDLALSTPDPMGKIADVAGSNATGYLMSAVGNAMEWDYIVPYFGRHQIVKGSVYSYFEFASPQLINDEEWRKLAPNQEFLPWIKPFVTKQLNNDYPQTHY